MKQGIGHSHSEGNVGYSQFVKRFLEFLLLLGPCLLGVRSIQASAEGGVLMIGDSLSVGRVSKTLQPLFERETGLSARVVASCGSRPRDWTKTQPRYSTNCGFYDLSASHREEVKYREALKNPHSTPKLSELLEEEKPSVLVIQQGTNMFGDLSTPTKIATARRELRALLEGVFSSRSPPRQCLWVAPPDTSKWSSEEEDRMYHFIADEVSAHCKVFDSRTVTRYPVKPGWIADGIHYDQTWLGRSQQDNWSEAIAAQLGSMMAPNKQKETPRRPKSPGSH